MKYDDEYSGYDVPIIMQFPISDIGAVNEYCTTSDLSRRLGIGAPQVSRHLRKLREAELLESVRDGKMVKHRLRMNAIYSIGYEFLTRIVK